MNLETILNALTSVALQQGFSRKIINTKLDRQYYAFRARILRMDAQQREDIAELKKALDMVLVDLDEDEKEIEHLKETCCHD